MRIVRISLAAMTLSSAGLAHAAPRSTSAAFDRLAKRVAERWQGETGSDDHGTTRPAAIETPLAKKTPAPVATAPAAAAPASARTRSTHRPWLELAPIQPEKPVTSPAATQHTESPRAITPSSLRGESSPRYGSESYRFEASVSQAPYQKLAADRRAPIERMLSQTQRPSLAQVMKTVREAHDGALPAENPFGSSSISSHGPAIADIVAQLEHAFPGGQWLPLGRDAVVIADLLDGFYTAIGQPTRVKRLDASGKSFPHYRDATPATYETDRPIIYNFLKSNGLDLNNLKGKAPYVMIDVTGYSPTSQSTQLVRSVYRTWAAAGNDPKALYDRVNFVGIPMGSARTYISDASDIDAEKARIKAGTTSEGPPELLYLRGPFGSLTYTSFWHDDFLKFTSDGKGGVHAPVGQLGSERERRNALAELYDIGKLTSSPAFLASVKRAAAEKYGYEFPLTQTERVTRVARVAPTSTSSLVAPGRTSKPMDSTYMSALKVRMAGPGNKQEIGLEFLKDMAGMWARKSATEAEVADAVQVIQQHMDLGDKAIDREVFGIQQRFPGFGAVMQAAMRKLPAASATPPVPATSSSTAGSRVPTGDKVWTHLKSHMETSKSAPQAARAFLHQLADSWSRKQADDFDVLMSLGIMNKYVAMKDPSLGLPWVSFETKFPGFNEVLSKALKKLP